MSKCKNTIRLFAWELDSMSEYSCSIPTGTTPWKMWKCNMNAYPNPGLLGESAREPRWVVGQYGEPEGDSVPITWFVVVLRYGPRPPLYSAPDWSNYERWKSDYKKEKEEEKERQAAKKRAREQRALEKRDPVHGLPPMIVNTR